MYMRLINYQPRDYTKNSHKGFGFVEFEDADDAAEALDNMDGSELHGKTLHVSLAQPSQVSNATRDNAAVWSTDEWFQQNSGMETAEQQEQRQRMHVDEMQLQEQVAMP
jgi:peptidyl-prolyl isomerase E (cyclophilin E)